MKGIMIFEGNKVEVFKFKGKVLFNPKHVAECLDIADVNSSIRGFSEKQVIKLKNSDLHDMHIRKLNNAGEKFLTESGVYKLIFKSKKEEAERFQDWVTDEVLPTIRQTGGYVSNDDLFIDTYLKFADETTKAMFKGTLETVRRQNELIELQKKELKNKETIIDNVISDDGLFAVGVVGKVLKSYCSEMGDKKIFKYLRNEKILINHEDTQRYNLPYDRYSQYFEIKYVDVDRGYYSATKTKAYFNGKGLKWFLNRLVKHGKMSKLQSEQAKNKLVNAN